MNSAYSAPREHLPLVETYEIVITAFVLAGGWFAWYLARERYHMTSRQNRRIGLLSRDSDDRALLDRIPVVDETFAAGKAVAASTTGCACEPG